MTYLAQIFQPAWIAQIAQHDLTNKDSPNGWNEWSGQNEPSDQTAIICMSYWNV